MARTRLLLPAALVAAAVGLPTATASAATVTRDGNTLVYTAADGEINKTGAWLDHYDSSKVRISAGYGVTITEFPADCDDQRDNGGFVTCAMPGALRYVLGDMDDEYASASDFPAHVPITVDGGAGIDDLRGRDSNDTLLGGPGNDKLSGWKGADVLDGGDGDDEISGGHDGDRLTGGAGNDMLHPDDNQSPATDVVDGGAGIDTIESDYYVDEPRPLLNFTLAGGADDGRPGENDDVQGVERLVLSAAARVVGTDGPDFAKLHQVGGNGELIGNGGDDELRGGDGADRIDGGAGADDLNGGFGDDTIIGGPGPDRIAADQTTSECSYLWCKHPFGNDVVEARDGEADSIDCGPGTDVAKVDAVDTVAATCETVDRAGPVVNPQVDPKKTKKKPAAKKVKLRGKAKLRTALRRGLSLSITGLKKGTKVKVTSGRKTVARGTARKAGQVKVTFTKSARRTLARKRSVKLTVVAPSVRETLTLKR